MKHPVFVLGLSFVLVIVCGAGISRASNATIVFCSDRDGDNEIYLMDADGTGVQQVTHNTFEESAAACSPDGRRVLFVSNRAGNEEIYIMNIDGSGLLRLTNDAGQDLGPSWSRDGMKIAFASDRDGDREIFAMNPDGSGLQQLTHNTGVDGFQDWSPDGTKVVFHSDRDGSVDIWTVDADGANPQQLTNVAAGDYMPEWSPDGTEIVFESVRNGPLELYIMNADGTGVQRLTYNFTDNHEPDWSPDGSQIMFVSFQGGDYDVMLINPNGTGLQNLTSSSTAMDWGPSWRADVIDDSSNGGGTGVIAYCYQPVSAPDIHEIYTINLDGTQNRQVIDATIGLNHHEWSPDGGQIAAVGYVNSTTWSIYLFDADGTNLTRLTTTAGVWDNEPSWSPDGTRFAWGRIYPAEGYRSDVWIMNADGTDQHAIGVVGDGVRWSPDGTRLLYHKELANVDIWSCDVDGTNEQQLTMSAGDNMAPDWSPDGTKIVFVSTRDGNHEIYVMDSDGANPRRMTNNLVLNFGPTWSPDGSLIAFTEDVTGSDRWEVFVMDSTGANVRRVTHMPPSRTAINPDWQPADSSATPVYLTGLACFAGERSVKLAWEVVEDADEGDFRLVAAARGGQPRGVTVTATGPRSFEAVDADPSLRAGGEVEYTLYARADDGGWDLLGTEVVEIAPPSAGARLIGAYPNPFNPHTTISFAVNRPHHVRIEIHDAAGRRVTTLVDVTYPAGDHEIRWNGRDAAGREVASGIYFLRFEAGKSTESRKLVLVR
jgi:Tol biopolymer transport system component